MKQTVLVLGGCRSGKSRYALETAEQISGQERLFMATLVPKDREMEERIRCHRKERGSRWKTIEIPLYLAEAVHEHSRKSDVIVIDCLTLWLSNLMLKNDNLEEINNQIQRLIQSLETAQCSVILVSNEVGTGIVPENRLARLFRDTAGFCNQQVAACANRVVWMVAGIPVTIKGDL